MTIEPLTQFRCIGERPDCVDEEEARKLFAEALVALERLDVPDRLGAELTTTLHALLDAHLGVCRTSSPEFDSSAAYRAGRPGLGTYVARRRGARSHLEALISRLQVKSYRPDGYDADALKREAEIGKDLWQTLRRAAGIQVKRGHSSKRFSNHEIGLLIDAARRHGTPKAQRAADAWEVLVKGNQVQS